MENSTLGHENIPDPSLWEIFERLDDAADRCGGEFRITFGSKESYITHWEKSGLYGVEVPKNVSLGTLGEVLAGLDRYVSAYRKPLSHEEGATELVLEDN